MKFNSFITKESKHKDTVISVGWSNSEEVYSCSDDHTLIKWSLLSYETVPVATLPSDFFPTDLHCCPRVVSSSGISAGKQVLDTLLISSSDGRFYIINKSGRIEKKVDAHKGAILSGRWSPDGAGILTAGEDGHIRIWSRSGMLRSTVVQSAPENIYAKWGPQGNSIIHTLGKCIAVKPLAANTKGIKWRAHDSPLTCISFCSAANLIISGAEDGRYKIWTVQGRQIYTSAAQQGPVSCLEWSPFGDVFAVGGYNSLRLCDKAGWSQSLDKPDTGSLYNIAWSLDGTQVAAACANGHVLFASVIERKLECEQWAFVLTSSRTIAVSNIMDLSNDVLELPDRITNMVASPFHLIVTTPTQCHIFKSGGWNTPTVLDLKEGCGAEILLAESHFAIIERQSVSVYTYSGRLLLTPRWTNMQINQLGTNCVSLGSDVIAIQDQSDQKAIHLFSINTSSSVMSHHNTSVGSVLKHTVNVQSIAVSKISAGASCMAVLDSNRDLFIVPTGEAKFYKIGVQIIGMLWGSGCNMLAAVHESRITIWFCPLEASGSPTLLAETLMENDISQFGSRPSLAAFDRAVLHVRRMDGALVMIPLPLHFCVLNEFVADKQWDKALKLCRLVNDVTAWWCLAAMASYYREMGISMDAFAATQSVDRVTFIQHIKDMPTGPQQTAECLLLIGRISEAETVLLQSGSVSQAVGLRTRMHHWDRALELAVKHKLDLVSLLTKRQQYLVSLNKTESNEKYIRAFANIPNSTSP